MAKEFNLKVSEDTQTIGELYETIRNSLPAIFRVELGHLGATNFEEFGGGEIVYVNNESVQRRVVARDSEHRLYTFPVDSRHVFYVIKGHDEVGEMTRLGDILDKKNLPVQVKVVDPKTYSQGVRIVRDSYMNDEQVPNMLLIEEYNEVYWLGHSIESSKVRPFSKPVYVPLYLDMLVKQCIGFEGQSDLHWKAYLEYLEDFTKDVTYYREVGFDEIRVSSTKEIQEMKVLSERTYDTIIEPQARSKMRIVSSEDKEKIKEIKQMFETWHSKRDSYAVDYGPPPPLPARGTPVDKQSTTKERTLSNSGVIDELSKVLSDLPKSADKEGALIKYKGEKPLCESGSRRELPDRPSTSGASVKMSRGGTVIKEFVHLKTKPNTGSDNSYSSFPKNGNNTTHEPNPIPTAPTINSKRDKSRKSLMYSGDTNQRDKISAMSISDVCSKLGELHLNKYADTFRKECVDGEILTQLDEDILKEDFGLKAIEAVRLMAFIRKGHIPK